MKNKKNVKKIIALVVICIILFLAYKYTNNNVLKIKKAIPFESMCQLYDGIKRDNCLVKVAFDKQDFEVCDNVNLPLLKDTCYLSFEQCNSITNNYFSYYCRRYSGPRPHMKSFITMSSNVTLVNIEKQCDSINPYSKLFCNYDYVISVSKKNFSKAIALCNNLGYYDEECKFLLSFKIIPSITQDLSFFMNYCSNFSKPTWKSECYYLIADELNALNDEKLLKNISDACEESEKFRNFQCFDHNSLIMLKDKQAKFCNLVPNAYKVECYRGSGAGLSKQYPNLSVSLLECGKISDNIDFIEECKNGISQRLMRKINEEGQNISAYVSLCSKINLRDCCYCNVGGSRVTKENNEIVMNITIIINDLNTLSYEKGKSYIKGLIEKYRGLGGKSKGAIKICSYLNTSLYEDCKETILREYNLISINNLLT